MVRWGLIGCGDVSERKSGPAYRQVEGFSLNAVCARSPGKAQDFAVRHQVPHYYTDASQLIADPNIDAVYIATPPDSHLSLALQVARATKICCIEKPMALNYAQCQQIQSAFEQHNIPLFVAYYRRCLAGFSQLKNWLVEQRIGEIRQVSWHYSRPPSKQDIRQQPNWRTQSQIAPGGYFDDIACHGLDIMTFLLGNVADASGLCTNQQGLYSAHDAIVANLLFDSGALGSCSWNFASADYQDQVQILGSEGQLSFSVFGSQAAQLSTASEQVECPMDKPEPIQGPFVQAMADHLNGLKAHPSQADSASHTSWIMDHILGLAND